MSTRGLIALSLIHVAAGAWFLRPASLGFPLDDAWSHMVYARSIATGHGFAYNPGSQELGMSAPLWTVLCAIPVGVAEWLALRPDWGVRALGLLAGIATSWAGFRLARRAGLVPGWFAALALALDPLHLYARFSGMEVALFGALLLLLVDAWLDRREMRAGWLAGLLFIARPEGAVMLPLIAWKQRRDARSVARLLLPAAAVIAPWLLYCSIVGGRPFPNTFLIKSELVLSPGALGTTALTLLADTGWSWALPIVALAGLISLEGGHRRLGSSLLCASLALAAAVLLSRPMMVGGTPARVPFYWQRYALVAWAPITVLAAAGLSTLARTALAGLRCRPAAAVVLIAPMAVSLIGARGLPAHVGTLRARFTAECRDVEALNVAAGRWIDAELARDAIVATHDAGAIRYFGRRPVVDLYGNNDRVLAELDDADARLAYVRALDVDALAVFPALWAMSHSPEYAALAREFGPLPASDWAAALGLTRRAATFHVDAPTVVPSPVHADLAIFVRP